MKASVYCLTTGKGVQSFYLEVCKETHYLFSQHYRRGVSDYFRHGVHLDAAVDFSRAGRNFAILNTMRKLFSYIKYIEKEFGIAVLRQTARKNASHKRSIA